MEEKKVEKTEAQTATTKATAPKNMPGLAKHRIVSYVLEAGRCKGETRPAIVVNYFGGDMVNLRVFHDTANDLERHSMPNENPLSVHYAEPEAGKPLVPGTWHWPPKV